MKNVWKYLLGLVVVLLFIGYVLFSRQNSGTAASIANPAVVDNAGSGVIAATGQYKDGTYTGAAADAFYGTLQASVVISGGRIVDVTFPQYPRDNGHSQQVSSFALPQLKQEAIAAQSANVNIVSGATQDSQAFQQSLASALAQAKS